MLARLPQVRAKDIVTALEKSGFNLIRQKGSHITLHNPDNNRTTVVPMHPGEFPRPLLKKIIKDTGLSEDQFRSLL
jgi:predicted RNA binding protein YcfA (HicA-like mRNA interferase family)